MIGAVVLAAGAGTRMGGVAKALLRAPDGQSFLARIVASATAAGVAPEAVVVVVAAPFGEAVAAEAARVGAGAVIENCDPGRGMASSVALGFAAIAERGEVSAAFLWPVDHPAVAADTVRALVARGEGVPSYDGRGGHPPLVPRRRFAALASCDGVDGGARTVLRDLPRVPVDDRGVIADVDEPADLEAAWPDA